MSMWLALLAGPLVSAQTPTPLTIGVEVDGSVAQGQMTYYSFMATPEQLELTLTVTPTPGDPDLYLNPGTAGCHSGGSAEGRGPNSGTMPT